VDPAEQEFLVRTPMRHVYAVDIQAKGAAKSAQETLGLLHADSREFIIHLDADVIAQEDLSATNVPGTGGLSLADVQSSLSEFAKSKNLLGMDLAQYNPEKDSDGSGAKKLVDLLVEALGARLTALSNPAPAASEETSSQTA